MLEKDNSIKFQSQTHGQLNINEVINHIKFFLEEEPDAQYSLVIGTDSQEKSCVKKESKDISLVTAILVHRKGFGGKYFWTRFNKNDIHSLREKIYSETISSLNFALEFVPLLRKSLNGNTPKYNLEIHIDVGDHGDTRDVIKEIVSMVTGSGFVAKTKPEAYGASYVADKHT